MPQLDMNQIVRSATDGQLWLAPSENSGQIQIRPGNSVPEIALRPVKAFILQIAFGVLFAAVVGLSMSRSAAVDAIAHLPAEVATLNTRSAALNTDLASVNAELFRAQQMNGGQSAEIKRLKSDKELLIIKVEHLMLKVEVLEARIPLLNAAWSEDKYGPGESPSIGE